MLVHMVAFKYKASVDAGARTEHRERLRALRDIDGIVDLKVGEDVVRSGRSYDTGLLVLFSNRAALDAYQKNARHVPVSQLGVASCDSIVAVDFESP
jgi:Stress responsive A/B Barrel Domain